MITEGYYDEIPQTTDSTLVVNGLAADAADAAESDKLEVNYGCKAIWSDPTAEVASTTAGSLRVTS